MNICILGVARSGTTAIYSLLQKVLRDNYEAVDFWYEPFLWDHDAFNDLYENVNDRFRLVDSISTEGIYHHLRLPMFIEDPKLFTGDDYLVRMLRKDENGVRLIKFIRASGRIRLIHTIDPDCRMILMVRNPLDVCNSILGKFSSFGGEFHQDDYPRFARETEQLFTAEKMAEPPTAMQKQMLYWKYMTGFMLSAARQIQPTPLVIAQEELSLHPGKQAKRLCNYLGIPYRDMYEDFAREKRSEVTKEFQFTGKEMESAEGYLDEYFELLKVYGVDHRIKRKHITGKYTIIPEKHVTAPDYYGLSPLVLKNEIKRQSRRLATLEQEREALVDDEKNELIKTKSELDRHRLILKKIKQNPIYRLFKFFFER